MDGVADVAGSWIDGYVYQQVHTPLCIVDRDVEGTVVCRRPSLMFQSQGTWQNQGFAVQLIPDADGSPDQLAQSFGVYASCDGALQLQTTEMGQKRVLDRDRCSDTVCAEDEHCELQEVHRGALPASAWLRRELSAAHSRRSVASTSSHTGSRSAGAGARRVALATT